MLTTIESLPMIQAPIFQNESWLLHGFGVRDIAIEKYLAAFRINEAVVPTTRQVHGNKVHILRANNKVAASLLEADAFVTDQPNIVCFIRTADCLPILLADTKHHVIGAIHSGWRGTAQKILLETMAVMEKEWGTKPADLKVAVGPAIGGHCYEVGFDVIKAFEKAGLFPGAWIEVSQKNKWYLDIAYANFHLLEQAGVLREQIYLSLACTACDLARFASFRKEGKKRGEQVGFIIKK